MATVPQLKDRAREAGIPGFRTMRKAELESAIAAAENLTVVGAVRADLAAIAQRAPDLARSGLAASALVLAGAMDSKRNSATSKAMCSKALLETMNQLRELAPRQKEKSRLDDLSAKREARRARGAAATG